MSRDEESRRTPTLRPPSPTSATVAEDDSTQEASSRSGLTGSGTRRLGENLTPLIQYLHKNIGRSWEAVYAGLCSLVAPGSAAQKQVLEHVNGLVATQVVLIDGKPFRLLEGGIGSTRKFQPLSGSKWDSLYVCPKTGALQTVARAEEPLRRTNPDVKPAGPLSQYRRINGIWYLVELAYIPSLVGGLSDHYDVLLHALLSDISSEEIRRMYGSYDRYAVSKRPLGKRELLRLADVLGS